ncbi:MAG: phenylalanine--tRNA ligase subunit beta [Candidatus Glassbacteria bacterium]|nr:phenylalanine--tRNA ligase subunit beta [Candidatus Glassbacteria bacterium]
MVCRHSERNGKMNLSYNWLKTLLDFDLDPHGLAERLTMLGHEVAGVQYLGEGLERVLVGRVLAVRPHPKADRLRLATVDYAGPGPVEVVCGAPNVMEGKNYPLALVGAVLPGGMEIKQARIRGVESSGMLCSEIELGLSDEASGLMELDGSLEPGIPLIRALGREDYRLVLEVTANRGDMWSHLGAARELQQFAGSRVRLPESALQESGVRIDELTSVTLEDSEGCPWYMARVIDRVKVGPSPRWLVERLEAVGQRSINNVVDVTNYILFELGQPLHSFDLDRLAEKRIVVRKAAAGEKIVTLDEVERTLAPAMTVIADAAEPVAVAGIMGGELSGIDETTVRVLLECAYFDPVNTRRTSRALGLVSDSSQRFERGTDYGLMPYAVDRAAGLIAEVSGGLVASGTIDVYPRRLEPRRVELRSGRARRVLGVGFSGEEVEKLLTGVDFTVEQASAEVFRVGVPTCRHDVRIEVDLIEELARLAGYDRIPVPVRMDVTLDARGRDSFLRENTLRHALRGMGFQEAMTSSFIGSSYVEALFGPGRFDPPRLVSPVSSEEDVLRPSLLATLLPCVQRNLNKRNRDLRLFETGGVFTRRPGDKGTGEQRNLALVVTGRQRPVHWNGSPAEFDFFSLKGMLESLVEVLKVRPVEFRAGAFPGLHPGVSAAVERDGRHLGFIGRLDPSVGAKLDLPGDICVLELSLERFLSGEKARVYRKSSQFPGVRRDLSVLVDLDLPCRELVGEIKAGSEIVAGVSLFDLYQGEHVPPGKKSLAFSVLFRSRERTLRDEEVDEAFSRIFRNLVKKFGVQPR